MLVSYTALAHTAACQLGQQKTSEGEPHQRLFRRRTNKGGVVLLPVDELRLEAREQVPMRRGGLWELAVGEIGDRGAEEGEDGAADVGFTYMGRKEV